MTAITVTTVDFGIDSEHTGDFRTFNEATVKQVLPQVVEFVRENSSRYSDRVVGFFSNHSV